MVAKQVLGFEAHRIFYMTLQLNDRETEYFRDSFDVKVVLLCKLEEINP